MIEIDSPEECMNTGCKNPRLVIEYCQCKSCRERDQIRRRTKSHKEYLQKWRKAHPYYQKEWQKRHPDYYKKHYGGIS